MGHPDRPPEYSSWFGCQPFCWGTITSPATTLGGIVADSPLISPTVAAALFPALDSVNSLRGYLWGWAFSTPLVAIYGTSSEYRWDA